MASLPSFRFGAEVYTWYMNNNGVTHRGKLGHMIEVTERAGFTGIEPIHFWMGELSDPDRLKEKLTAHNVSLAAIALCLNWNEIKETEQEEKDANQTIELLKSFPNALLCLVQIPTGRHDLTKRREILINHINQVSTRASAAGIPCTFHPNSPNNSITRTEDDYHFLLNALNPKFCGWTPDVGHIINGGMNPLLKMKEYASLINLVHFKDWKEDHEFSLMGTGKVDFLSITQWLKDIDYKGWIICEDEGKEAFENPDQVTLHDGRWIREDLLPNLK